MHSKAITAAGSATATDRCTTPPDASAKVPRRRTSPSQPIPSCPTHASKSAEEHQYVRSIDLCSANWVHPLARLAVADRAVCARYDDHVSDAPEPELLVRVRRHPHLLPRCADRHARRPGDALCAEREHGVRQRRKYHARCKLRLAASLCARQRRLDVLPGG